MTPELGEALVRNSTVAAAYGIVTWLVVRYVEETGKGEFFRWILKGPRASLLIVALLTAVDPDLSFKARLLSLLPMIAMTFWLDGLPDEK